MEEPEWYEVAICDGYLSGRSVADLSHASGLSAAEVAGVLERAGVLSVERWSCLCAHDSKHVPSECPDGFRVAPGGANPKAPPGGVPIKTPPYSEVIDASHPEVPPAAARVARAAAANGWAVRLVLGRGTPPRGLREITSVSVRMNRSGVGVVGFWESGKFTLGVMLTQDRVLVRLSARELSASANS